MSLIPESWNYARRQPALMQVGFWLFAIPSFLLQIASGVLEESQKQEVTDMNTVVLFGLAILLLNIVMIWGTASVMVIGKRKLQSNAGRARTSFKAVRGEALKFVIPILLTSILRIGMMLLWSLPLILFIAILPAIFPDFLRWEIGALIGLLCIPPLIYGVRTVFFDVIIIAEGLEYRAALKRSMAIIKGQIPRVLWSLVVLGVVFGIPVVTVNIYLMESVQGDRAMELGVFALSALLNACLSALYLLSMMGLFKRMRD